MRNRFRRHLTPANVLATLALVIAASGTSYAAVVYTGASVRDSTVTGKDVKLTSLTAADIEAKTRAALRGKTGATGAAGRAGAKGDRGPKGPTGPTGNPSNVRASFASWDAAVIDTTNPGLNTGLADWYAWSYGGGCASPDCHVNLVNAVPLTGTAAAIIDLTSAPPTGGAGSASGAVTTAWQDSTLMAWATVSLLYRTGIGGNPSLHTRVECWMTIDGIKAGPAVLASAGVLGEIQTISVIGNTQRPPGTYDAQVRCRDADANAASSWIPVRSNLTFVANEQV